MLTRRTFIAGSATALALIHAGTLAAQSDAGEIQFNRKAYLFRWTDGKLFEFTPAGQEDLDKWTSMISVLAHRDRGTPDLLAEWANNLADSYKEKGKLLRTNSVPATAQRPAEHFLAGMLSAKGLVECTFNRFLLMRNVGYSFISSYRVYGDEGAIFQQMGGWIKDNGTDTETALMNSSVPDIDKLERWQKGAGVR